MFMKKIIYIICFLCLTSILFAGDKDNIADSKNDSIMKDIWGDKTTMDIQDIFREDIIHDDNTDRMMILIHPGRNGYGDVFGHYGYHRLYRRNGPGPILIISPGDSDPDNDKGLMNQHK